MVYRFIYNLLRNNAQLNFLSRKLAAHPLIELLPPYQLLLARRIRKLIAEFEDFPPVVLIGITNRCNARCVMCPIDLHPLAKGIMGMPLFRKIITECREQKVKKIILSGGEPTLDSDLIDKIRLAREALPRASIVMFTNGSLLTTELSGDLVLSGIDEITISFDASDQSSYETIRKNLVFQKVLDNTRTLMETRTRLGRSTPLIRFNMISMETNFGTHHDFLREFGRIADLAEINNPHNWANTVDEKKFKAKVVYGRHTGAKRLYPCYLELYRITIHWDGAIPVCNYDFFGGGNTLPYIKGTSEGLPLDGFSMKTAWDAPEYKNFRGLHTDLAAKRWRKIRPCVNCTHSQSWWLEPY